MLSNVSLLWPQLWQVTRERSFPPKSLWTHVVSASFGSSFLARHIGGLGRDGGGRGGEGLTEGILRDMIFAERLWHSARIRARLPVGLVSGV